MTVFKFVYSKFLPHTKNLRESETSRSQPEKLPLISKDTHNF